MGPENEEHLIERALAALDEDKLVEIAKELTSIASPVGDDAELAQALAERIRAEGLSPRVQPFAPNQSNVLTALEGSGDGRSLMFLNNLENDFSPAATSVPAPEIVDGEWLQAAGIWNMKGTYAASLAAAIAVRDAGIPLAGDVVVTGVAAMMDEAPVDTRIRGTAYAGYGAGAKHMLGRGCVADMCVVGPPTSFKLVKKHFGTTAVRIDLVGPALFSGVIDDLTGYMEFLPAPGAGVIEQAADVVRALSEWMPGYQQRNAVDGTKAWVRITGIEGGSPWSPVPAGETSIFVFAGTPPGAETTAVLDEIRAVLDAVRAKHPDLTVTAEPFSVNPGPSVPDDSPLVAAVEAAHRNVFGTDVESAVAPFHTDASPLSLYGIPAVNYGPTGKLWPEGDSIREAVRIRDLVDCARVYTDLIVRVCT